MENLFSSYHHHPLPDVHQNIAHDFPGKTISLSHVGISGFKTPLLWKKTDTESVSVEASIDFFVSLSSGERGVHMSRFVQYWVENVSKPYGLSDMKQSLYDYKKSLQSSSASIKIQFNYPIQQPSLRSGRSGYQYYPVTIEATLDSNDSYRQWLTFNIFYSSACPCSSELAEHARTHKGIYSVPHSQRSQATIRAELDTQHPISIECLYKLCSKALKTETQVVVKRADEQAFAELNGQYLKFVEDAVRLLYMALSENKKILHFDIECVHYESLHSHNAVARVSK